MTLTERLLAHNTIFITGTDTEVGKTYITVLLIKYLRKQGISVFPFKPIAAGTEWNKQINELVNEDALALFKAAQDYELAEINPIVFDEAIAPHIAAEKNDRQLSKGQLTQLLEQTPNAKVRLIEGAGGWHLPLNNSELMSDWVIEEGMPVILVVGIKLGCLNHTLLTAQAIENQGGHIIGWVANFIEGKSEVALANAEYLQGVLNAPLLASVDKNQTDIE